MRIRNLLVMAIVVLVLTSAQVLAASCLDEIESKKTSDFLVEIPTLSPKLATCDNTVRFFKNEIVLAQIAMQDGSKQGFTLTLAGGKVTKIENSEATKPTYVLNIGECEFDTFLRASDKGGAFAYLYLQKKVKLSANGFFRKIKLGVIKIGLGMALKKIQTPVDVACTTE